MKNKLKSIAFLLAITLTSCKAQIAPLYKADPNLPEGTYYKDLDNDLDKFVGTWVWQNNNTILTIVLEKKEHVHDPVYNQYNDMIIGESKYVENGIEIYNYLSRLSDETITGHQYYISGDGILHKNHPPKCQECGIDEKRLSAFFTDPEIPYVNSRVVLRYITVGSQEQLEFKLTKSYLGLKPNEDSPESTRLPPGDYLLIKQ